MGYRFILFALVIGVTTLEAQQAPRVYTIQELFTRNVGTREEQDKQFPPHKIIGNVYYVGTESLASFLITTPAGNILINSIYERTVPTIKDSVQKLGFKFEDIKILIGSHSHGDHQLTLPNCLTCHFCYCSAPSPRAVGSTRPVTTPESTRTLCWRAERLQPCWRLRAAATAWRSYRQMSGYRAKA